MVHEADYPDFSTICRLCLANDANVEIFGNSKFVSLRIMTCLALEVRSSDNLPSHLCSECRYQLEKAYYFRKKSQATDNKLRKHVRLVTLGKTSRLFYTKSADEEFEDELEYEDSLNFLRAEDERREKEKSEAIKQSLREELRNEVETELRESLRMECIEHAKIELRHEVTEECRREEMQQVLSDLEIFLNRKRSTTNTLSSADDTETRTTQNDEVDKDNNTQHKERAVKRAPLSPHVPKTLKKLKMGNPEQKNVKSHNKMISVVKYSDIAAIVDNSVPFSIIPVVDNENNEDKYILQETTGEEQSELPEQSIDLEEALEDGEDDRNGDDDDSNDVNCDELQDFYATELDTFHLASSGDSNPHNKDTTSYEIDMSDIQFYKNSTNSTKSRHPNNSQQANEDKDGLIVLNYAECMEGDQYDTMKIVNLDNANAEKDDAADTPTKDAQKKREKRLLRISSFCVDEDDGVGETGDKQYVKLMENSQRQTDTAKSFKCDRCPSVFSTPTLLARHTRSHERGEQQGVEYECPQCQIVLSCRSALTRHMIIHTGERPHQCPFCEKSFGQREVLKRHLTTHTGEKPFKCTLCNRTFAQKANLTSHMRSAHSSKPNDLHMCPLCSKRFNHASGLSRHLVTHNGVHFQCSKCERKFYDRSSVKRHIANIHRGTNVDVNKVEELVPDSLN